MYLPVRHSSVQTNANTNLVSVVYVRDLSAHRTYCDNCVRLVLGLQKNKTKYKLGQSLCIIYRNFERNIIFRSIRDVKNIKQIGYWLFIFDEE